MGVQVERPRNASVDLALYCICNNPCQTGGQQQNLGRQAGKRGSRRGAKIENPCVGGSILPRANKNIPTKRQPMQVGVFVSLVRSPRVRSMSGTATSALKGFASTSVPARRRPKTHIFTARIFSRGIRAVMPVSSTRQGTTTCLPLWTQFHALRQYPLEWQYETYRRRPCRQLR